MQLSKSQFEEMNYSRKTLIKTYKNGCEDYMVLGKCAKCNGTGYLTWTSVDNGICYQCKGLGNVTFKVKVVPNEISEARKAEAQRKFQAALDARKEAHIKNGYKTIDWKFADWFCDCNKNAGWKYYLIKKETEKAVLVSLLVALENTEYEIWMPKKAMVR